MTKSKRTIIAVLWIVAVVAMIGVLLLHELPRPTVAGRVIPVAEPVAVNANDLPHLYDAPAFSLTDQNSQPVSNAQLAGHPWVADFIFTQCASLCPMMSTRLSAMQGKIDKQVKFVSFSVDPVHDTPAALLDYAARYKAEPGRWIFLTGQARDEATIVSGMKMYFAPADGGNPIQHDQHYVLVDADGHVRGVYNSDISTDLEQLVHDANLLASAHPEVAAK